MNPSLTKGWAEALEAVFRGDKPPESVLVYEPLCLAQEAVTPTNLTFMQAVAINEQGKARIQFDALRRNQYWLEGYSYLLYCLPALSWAVKKIPRWTKITEVDIMLTEAEAMCENCPRLAFPDGSLPLPEVSADVRIPFDPLTAEDDYEDASYRVHRWFNADHTECLAQLLICLDTNPEPRANLHYHLAAGYFVLWVNGVGYVNRVAPYTGFDAVRNTESADVADCLPDGALSPTWRLNPPEVYSGRDPGECWFDWLDPLSNFTNSIASRSVTWNPQRVSVIDNGITRAWVIPQE